MRAAQDEHRARAAGAVGDRGADRPEVEGEEMSDELLFLVVCVPVTFLCVTIYRLVEFVFEES
jgi:hypothetical protein